MCDVGVSQDRDVALRKIFLRDAIGKTSGIPDFEATGIDVDTDTTRSGTVSSGL
jgi:hypothetical protein